MLNPKTGGHKTAVLNDNFDQPAPLRASENVFLDIQDI